MVWGEGDGDDYMPAFFYNYDSYGTHIWSEIFIIELELVGGESCP